MDRAKKKRGETEEKKAVETGEPERDSYKDRKKSGETQSKPRGQ